MKRSFFIFLILTIVVSLFSKCSQSSQAVKKTNYSKDSPEKNSIYHKRNFDSLMLADRNLRLDYFGELLNDTAFDDVLEHGTIYLKDVTEFLSNKHFNDMQAGVCLCVMQKLAVNDYVKFCKLLISLYDRGKLTDHYIIDYAVCSPPGFLNRNRIIIDHYDDPDVVKLLESIRDDNKMPEEFRNYIRTEAISGKAKHDLDSVDEDN